MSAVKFSTSKDGLSYFEVHFENELRGGSDLVSEDFQKLIKKIRDAAESRIVFLDLNKVRYWDTEGMRQILGLVSDLNKKLSDQRVFIIAPKTGYLFIRAKEKYSLDSQLIPWKETKDGLI